MTGAIAASLPPASSRGGIPSPQRLVQQLWRAYCYALATSPLATQSLTAVVGFAAGDACAQLLSTRPECQTRGGRVVRAYRRVFRRAAEPQLPPFQFDWQRTARLAAFGGAIAGPMGHAWFQMLDKRIMPRAPRSVPAIALKCVLDQTFMAPLGCALFYASQAALAGAPHTAVPTLREKFVPTMSASYKLWPAAHLINFALVPPAYRVLYTNLVSVLWTCILSKTAADRPVRLAASGNEAVPLCVESSTGDDPAAVLAGGAATHAATAWATTLQGSR